jgi:hypothetical protein
MLDSGSSEAANIRATVYNLRKSEKGSTGDCGRHRSRSRKNVDARQVTTGMQESSGEIIRLSKGEGPDS